MKKRIAMLFLAATMLFSTAACQTNSGKDDDKTAGYGDEQKYTQGYDETKYNAPGTFPIFKEKQVITTQLPSNGYVEDFQTNTQTLLLEKNLNADLKIEVIPSKEYNTKINLMAAAGGDEFADAVMGKFSDTAVYNYAQNDLIVPVTNYYYNRDVAYYLNTQRDNIGWNFFKHVTMPDGQIYGIASINETISNMNSHKMWVYGPWLEKLGIKEEDIKTVEDFKNLLLDIKTKDPNGNGLMDEVPICAPASGKEWFKYLMNAFVYAGDGNYLVVDDGELSFAYQTEQWREGLRYFKDLYDNGLIADANFSQDSNSYKALLNNKTIVVGAFGAVGPGVVDGGDTRRVDYVGIAPLFNKEGVQIASYTPASASTRFLISKKVADPETVFRFGDYMISDEISMHSRWGEKGVDWLIPSETDKSMYDALGYDAVLVEVLQWSILQNKHWYQTGPYICRKAVSAGVVWSGNPLDHNRTIAEAQLKYEGHNPKETVAKLILTPDEAEIAVDGFSALNSYVNEMTANFITGAKDIDKDWEQFQDQIEAIGSEKILATAQTAFDRMNDN